MMYIPQSLEDISCLVKEKISEHQQLDFKQQLPDPGKNDDLAKIIAAMANSQGGVIIYGIIEDNLSCARGLNPFPLKDAAERVSMVAGTSIDEPVKLSEIKIIEQSDGNGFLVIVIPHSERAPHFVNGTAYCRTPRTTSTLTRRQIGELFSLSSGFVNEFSLRIARPGRVVVRIESEPMDQIEKHLDSFAKPYLLIVENDGESDVFNVRWNWDMNRSLQGLPELDQNPFPIQVMHPGEVIKINAIVKSKKHGEQVITASWFDDADKNLDLPWTVIW